MVWGTSLKNKAVFSIKRRLTGSVILLALALVVLSLYYSFQAARHEIKEVYDARLGQTAKLLLLTTSVSATTLADEAHQHQFDQWMNSIRRLSAADDDKDTTYGHPYEQNILFQFYQHDRLLWSSNKQVGPLSPAPTFAGFGNRDIEGEQWRFFQLHATADEYVVVAEKHSIRQEMIDEIALSTALPQLILIPALMALLIFLIDKNFRPISELRSAIAQRSAHKLDRIYVANQTLELSPLVDTLNELLEQLEQAWQREKRFTRMAAHELKTPLTILRLNAENAINSETRHQLEQDLDNILKGIGRTDRMLHQLLTLAKVESITNVRKQPCELKTLLQSVVADLAPLALRHHQTLSLEGDNVTIDGDEVLLGILFRNLVDNAIRYSGDHSVIDVVIKQHADGIDVTVSDNGANLSDETRDKLFDNFYRANTEKGDGAGLGMSITRDIAQLHNASITLLPRTQDKNTFRIRFSQA